MEDKKFTDAEMKQAAAELGKRGGIKSRGNMNYEQRAGHCKKMAQIRWAKATDGKMISDAFNEMPVINAE